MWNRGQLSMPKHPEKQPVKELCTFAHYTHTHSLWGETDGQAVWSNVSRSISSYILRQKPWDISKNHLYTPGRWRWYYLACSVMMSGFHYCHLAIPKATYRRCIFHCAHFHSINHHISHRKLSNRSSKERKITIPDFSALLEFNNN